MAAVMSFLQYSAVVLLAAAALAYKYATYHYGKWKRLGVPHEEPAPMVGNVGATVAGRAHPKDLLHALYRRYRGHRYFGVYVGRDPALVLRDPGLVHAVMVRDFAHFYDRLRDKTSFRHDQLFDHLINLRGARWKAVRAKLSPTFSAAKLKAMLADMNVCTARLAVNLDEQIANNNGRCCTRRRRRRTTGRRRDFDVSRGDGKIFTKPTPWGNSPPPLNTSFIPLYPSRTRDN